MSGFPALAASHLRILETCESVVSVATHVTIDDAALEAFALTLVRLLRLSCRIHPCLGCRNVLYLSNSQDTSLPHLEWDSMGWHYTSDASSGGPLTAQVSLCVTCRESILI